MTQPQTTAGRLVWIDLEMTGLDPDNDRILEIATLVTDASLEVLAEGPELAIAHSQGRLEAMDDWNRSHHSGSGLWQRSRESAISVAEAESRTVSFLREWVEEGTSPICGNSIAHDRRFLRRYMPELERFFHYRQIDVSTIKELARRWAPTISDGFRKQGAHTALADVRESLEELRYYRRFMGALAGEQEAGARETD